MIRKKNQSPAGAQQQTSFGKKVALMFFGTMAAFFILEVLLQAGGFVLSFLQERKNMLSLQQGAEIRILCLGESTTVGTYEAGGDNSYPRQLETVLNERNLGKSFSVINKGVIGTDTETIVDHVEEYLNQYNPQIVVVMMGINDEGEFLPYRGISRHPFLKYLKIYKFFALLREHLKVKLFQKNTIPMAHEMRTEKSDQGKDPAFVKKFIMLGEQSKSQGDYERARLMYEQAVHLGSVSYIPYMNLGWCYRKAGELQKAEAMFKKAIELNPYNDAAYAGLGRCYKDQGMEAVASAMFRKALEMNSFDGGIYQGLAWYVNKSSLATNPIEIYERGIELNPIHSRSFGALALQLQHRGLYPLAQEYYQKANQLRLVYQNIATARNYRKLKRILDKNGAQLVCVQYPNRSIEPLKKIFEYEAEGVIFVDNEKVFRDVLNSAPINEYFMDVFGGDFGHCTIKGNKLLATNIADVVQKEYLNR